MPRRKRPNTAGVVATNLPKPMRWKLDYDYLPKLSPKEREWLSAFSDAHYGGDFRAQSSKWPQAARRKTWRDLNSARRDVYTLAALGGGPEEFTEQALTPEDLASRGQDGTPVGLDPTPAYLNSPEYKAARDAFRNCLAPPRVGPLAPPKETPALDRARRALSIHTPYDGDDDDESPPEDW